MNGEGTQGYTEVDGSDDVPDFNWMMFRWTSNFPGCKPAFNSREKNLNFGSTCGLVRVISIILTGKFIQITKFREKNRQIYPPEHSYDGLYQLQRGVMGPL